MWYLNWRAEENLVVNNKDNRVFTSRNYRSDSSSTETLYCLRWLNRVMQDHEARASDLNRKLIFSFFLLFSY